MIHFWILKVSCQFKKSSRKINKWDIWFYSDVWCRIGIQCVLTKFWIFGIKHACTKINLYIKLEQVNPATMLKFSCHNKVTLKTAVKSPELTNRIGIYPILVIWFFMYWDCSSSYAVASRTFKNKFWTTGFFCKNCPTFHTYTQIFNFHHCEKSHT